MPADLGICSDVDERQGEARIMKQFGRWLAVIASILLAGCATLPPLQGRVESLALTDTSQTRLGTALAGDIKANPGKSGVHSLGDPRDAFAARGLLARAAEKSIDAQYYIWHDDQAGQLLFETLWNAAERGVRVRLLLDDNSTRGLDAIIATLDAHPNIEVRLYNPFPSRGARAADFLSDFTRVNRRAHNKSFTVDNQASVIGGRNIGDEYFKLGSGLGFTDADVLVVGPIVREISDTFDRYWNSPSAYPAASLVAPPAADAVAVLKARFAAVNASPESVTYLDSLRATPLVTELVEHRIDLEWTTMKLVVDDPAKTLDTTGRQDILLYPQLLREAGRPQETLDIVSPYFVPSDEGVNRLCALAKGGVKVRILTNSLAASDEYVVHSGYSPHRLKLVQAGVHLWELAPTVAKPLGEKAHIGSSSSSALHAKVFSADQRRTFVGSYNFDQRSAHLNTEQGLLIDSTALGRRLAQVMDADLPYAAYEVILAPDGHSLQWIERGAAGEVRYDVDPHTSWWLRAKVDMLSLLPIDWLL